MRHHRSRRRRLRGGGYFRHLGPGFVTGAADDDPSGIGTYSQVGARFGYGLLWSVPAVAPSAVAVQELSARLGLVTGRGLATLIRRRFPRPVLVGAVVLTVVANVFNIAADVGSMAAATRLFVSLPTSLIVVVLVAVMLTLEIALTYRRYARVLRWLVLSLLSYVLVLATIDVDWSSVIDRLLHPGLAGGAAELAALIAVFGTTVSPYLFFWQASEEVEEEGASDETGPSAAAPLEQEHLRAMRVDVTGGMLSAVIVAFVIMVVTASTLHPAGVTEITTPQQAADALRPLAGDASELLFALGILGLGLLAVPVLAGSTAYALAEALAWHEGLSQRLRDARGFYAIVALAMLSGVLVGAVGLDAIQALYYAAILNGVVAPPLIVLMIILGRDPEVAGEHTSGALSTTVLALTVAAGTILPIACLVAR